MIHVSGMQAETHLLPILAQMFTRLLVQLQVSEHNEVEEDIEPFVLISKLVPLLGDSIRPYATSIYELSERLFESSAPRLLEAACDTVVALIQVGSHGVNLNLYLLVALCC